jgi:hypothetical protein
MRYPATIPLLLTLVVSLSACGAGGKTGVASASQTPVVRPGKARGPVRQPITRPPPQAQVQHLPGLEGVIGSTAAQLARQFGASRLDVWEGDARKLQFTGTPCVLDVYLYPSAAGREPQATFVDARRTDGREVDRAACIQALRKP